MAVCYFDTRYHFPEPGEQRNQERAVLGYGIQDKRKPGPKVIYL